MSWVSSSSADRHGEHARRPANRQPLVGRLVLLVALAFAFGFALVPLYNVLCEATGFNGKTADPRRRAGRHIRVMAAQVESVHRWSADRDGGIHRNGHAWLPGTCR